LPSQFSATSQSPFTGRHGVPAVAWFVSQLPDPSQVSAAVHASLVGSPHAVPALASFA